MTSHWNAWLTAYESIHSSKRTCMREVLMETSEEDYIELVLLSVIHHEKKRRLSHAIIATRVEEKSH